MTNSQLETHSSRLPTIYIVGPTASGKTAASLEIARSLGGEIVCADSQTVRRGMDIGTAKPSHAEQARVPHHLIDIIDPYEEFSLAAFLGCARPVIDDIKRRGKIPIVTGGTGLYIDALFYNFELPRVIDTSAAKDLELKSVDELQAIVRELGLAMPTNSLNPRHLKNTILRAGELGTRTTPKPHSLIAGILPAAEVLSERIDRRVESMFAQGFVKEVRDLITCYGRPPTTFDAIGYKIVMRHLDGEVSLDEAKELIKIADRQYAKRQRSWFRRNPSIAWFDSPEALVSFILKSC